VHHHAAPRRAVADRSRHVRRCPLHLAAQAHPRPISLDLFAVLLGGRSPCCRSTPTRFCMSARWARLAAGCPPSARSPWPFLSPPAPPPSAGPGMLWSVAGFGAAIVLFGLPRILAVAPGSLPQRGCATTSASSSATPWCRLDDARRVARARHGVQPAVHRSPMNFRAAGRSRRASSVPCRGRRRRDRHHSGHANGGLALPALRTVPPLHTLKSRMNAAPAPDPGRFQFLRTPFLTQLARSFCSVR